jgi:aminomethyltransferase
MESVVVGDIQNLPEGHSRLTVFTNDKGGIIDDTMVTNAGDHLYVVINAGCADKDIAHLNAKLAAFQAAGGEATIQNFGESNSLLAVQGPHTERLLHKLGTTDLGDMPFMTQKETKIANVPVLVTRCGYTGEDGFEISMPHDQAIPIIVTLLEGTTLDEHRIKPAGLGARDTLRLEAGLCLYGHELNEDITPIEAALGWLISKRRREEGGFPGAEIIQNQLKNGVTRKRVGITIKGAPVRDEAIVYNPANGEEIGKVTSGTFSPTLKAPIAMGYVKNEFSKLNTKVLLKVRGKDQEGTITKMPFVPHNYKKITETKAE